MKRTLLFLALLLSSLGAFAFSFSKQNSQGKTLYYNINSGTNSVTVVSENSNNPYYNSENSPSGDITIPESVTNDGTTYQVTAIGDYAFYSCSGLTSVTIPNSVTSIGNWAFYGCSGLTSVTIPNSVTSIGNTAFAACYGLTCLLVASGNTVYDSRGNCNAIIETSTNTLIAGCKNTTIPNSVTSIGEAAFLGCSGLTSVTIPNSVTSIGYSAFASCSTLTSVTIPNSVTSIGQATFSGCSGLTSVTIPNSVTSIGNSAFSRCSGLTSIDIPNSVTSIGESAFFWCSGLTSIDIPNSVTSIGESAFFWCSGLTSVTIPNSVTTIGERVFYNCSRLTSVTIPNSVTSIGRYAFENCSGLTSVTIGNSVTTIESNTFSGCTFLTSVTIPNSVTSIGSSAFYGCDRLTSLIIPNSVITIGDNAFMMCSSLTSVTIPNSVTSIRNNAFRDCSGLTSIIVESGNTYYDSRNNCNAIIETNTNKLIAGCKNTIIPNSVTSIGNYAFYYCSRLTSVTIPNSVTSIGRNAFEYCSGLTSVTIGSSVTSIEGSAFMNCTQLATVYDYSNLPITRGSSNYGGVARNATRVIKVLTDDRGDFNAPSDYTVEEATYTRSYEQGNRSTICLPFKPTTVNGQPTTNLKFYAFAGFDGSTITFIEVAFANLQANTPYMVEWPASKAAQDFVFGATGSVSIHATGTVASRTVTQGDGKFIGTMDRTCMDNTNYYGYKNGYFVQSAGGQAEDDHAHVNPFRAYFQITPSNAQGFAMPTELSVRFNTAEDNVGIDSVEPQQSNIRYSNDVYDMMGRMVRKNAESLDGLRKGVYIWKGEKKVVF